MSPNFDMESKIYHNILLLTAHDEFLQDVEIIRKDYDINWICGNESEMIEEYFFGDEDIEREWPFLNHVNDCDRGDFESYDSATGKLTYPKSEKYKKYIKSIAQLMKKYHLTGEYKKLLDIYVQQGFICPDIEMLGNSLSYPDLNMKEGFVTIKIYPNTSRKDYDLIWKLTQSLLEIVEKRHMGKKISNLNIDVKITQLKNTDMSSVEIAEEIRKEYGKRYSYHEIDEIAYLTKKRLKKFLEHQNI